MNKYKHLLKNTLQLYIVCGAKSYQVEDKTLNVVKWTQLALKVHFFVGKLLKVNFVAILWPLTDNSVENTLVTTSDVCFNNRNLHEYLKYIQLIANKEHILFTLA